MGVLTYLANATLDVADLRSLAIYVGKMTFLQAYNIPPTLIAQLPELLKPIFHRHRPMLDSDNSVKGGLSQIISDYLDEIDPDSLKNKKMRRAKLPANNLATDTTIVDALEKEQDEHALSIVSFNNMMSMIVDLYSLSDYWQDIEGYTKKMIVHCNGDLMKTTTFIANLADSCTKLIMVIRRSSVRQYDELKNELTAISTGINKPVDPVPQGKQTPLNNAGYTLARRVRGQLIRVSDALNDLSVSVPNGIAVLREQALNSVDTVEGWNMANMDSENGIAGGHNTAYISETRLAALKLKFDIRRRKKEAIEAQKQQRVHRNQGYGRRFSHGSDYPQMAEYEYTEDPFHEMEEEEEVEQEDSGRRDDRTTTDGSGSRWGGDAVGDTFDVQSSGSDRPLVDRLPFMPDAGSEMSGYAIKLQRDTSEIDAVDAMFNEFEAMSESTEVESVNEEQTE